MTDHLIEQEQVDRIKSFLRNHGKPILIGLTVGLIIIAGWHYYKQYQNKVSTEASIVYEKLLRDTAAGNREAVLRDAKFIITNYKKTPYAFQAALILARQAVYDGDYAAAIERLQWVISKAKLPAIRQAARLRLARVFLAKQDYVQALQTLDTIEDPTYKMAIYEIRGDILLAKGDIPAASAAYHAALRELAKEDFSYPLLQMKYDDLLGRDKAMEKELAGKLKK